MYRIRANSTPRSTSPHSKEAPAPNQAVNTTPAQLPQPLPQSPAALTVLHEPQHEPRFDLALVKRVIAQAEMMQTEHHAIQAQRLQVLSIKEMEALASEVGVDPVFIRRALPQVQADLQTEAAVEAAKRAKRALYRRACFIAVNPVRAPLYCLLALSTTLPWFFTPRPAVNWLYLLIPLILAFVMALVSKPKSRRRALQYAVGQGLLFSTAGLGALFFSVVVNRLGYPNAEEFRIVALVFVWGGFLAALTGVVIGAMLRRGFGKLLAAAEAAEMAEAAASK